mmetsp:Transcript_61914/g.147460  ORF Transcript_61914/g.147460 Transcript_61914/m.147460 type:complete len:265 (-) Transcript_61914:577-1371(-)
MHCVPRQRVAFAVLTRAVPLEGLGEGKVGVVEDPVPLVVQRPLAPLTPALLVSGSVAGRTIEHVRDHGAASRELAKTHFRRSILRHTPRVVFERDPVRPRLPKLPGNPKRRDFVARRRVPRPCVVPAVRASDPIDHPRVAHLPNDRLRIGARRREREASPRTGAFRLVRSVHAAPWLVARHAKLYERVDEGIRRVSRNHRDAQRVLLKIRQGDIHALRHCFVHQSPEAEPDIPRDKHRGDRHGLVRLRGHVDGARVGIREDDHG